MSQFFMWLSVIFIGFALFVEVVRLNRFRLVAFLEWWSARANLTPQTMALVQKSIGGYRSWGKKRSKRSVRIFLLGLLMAALYLATTLF